MAKRSLTPEEITELALLEKELPVARAALDAASQTTPPGRDHDDESKKHFIDAVEREAQIFRRIRQLKGINGRVD